MYTTIIFAMMMASIMSHYDENYQISVHTDGVVGDDIT